MLVAAFGRTMLDPAARHRAVAVVLPVVAYGVWFLAIGRDPVSQPGHLASLAAVSEFVVRGIGHAVGAVSGIGTLPGGVFLGVVAFGLASLATGWMVVSGQRPPALAAGCLLAVAAMYVLIGLARAGLETDFSTRSRYVYVAAFLLVLTIADWLPNLRDATSGRPRRRIALTGALLIILVAVTTANLTAFGHLRTQFGRQADLTRAYVGLAMSDRGKAGWADPDSVLSGMPPLPVLLATIERFGSPVRDDLVPTVARAPGPRAREEALLRMVGFGFRVEPSGADGAPLPLDVVRTDDVTASWDDLCLTLTNGGGKGRVTVAAPSGSRIRVVSSKDAEGSAWLGLTRAPSVARHLALRSGVPLNVVVPDIGDGSSWTVRLDIPNATGHIEVCRVARPLSP